MQELVQSLVHTTAFLGRAAQDEPDAVERALAERGRAIEAIQRLIAAEASAGRAISEAFAGELTTALEKGRQILVRLTLARELMRSDRLAVERELQVLNGIRRLCAKPSGSLSLHG